jgi:hypothetical protein
MAHPSIRTGDSSRRFAIAVLVTVVAANAALHLALLHATPYLDEGCFASSGKWILDGALFYRDTWNERGPLVYFLSAAWFTVAPYSLASARILALLLSTGQILLLHALARRWIGGRAALAAPIYYLAWHALFHGTFYLTEQIEGILVLAALVALDGSTADGPTPRRAAIAGGLLSLLTMDKQTGVVLFVIGAAFVAGRTFRRRTTTGALAAYLAAAAAPWVVLLTYYAARGGVAELVRGLLFPFLEYRVSRYTQPPNGDVLALFAPTLAVLVAGIARHAVRARRWAGLWVSWIVGAAALGGPNLFQHHVLDYLLPAAIAFADLLAFLAGNRRAARAIGAAALFAAASIAVVIPRTGFVTRELRGDRWAEIEAMAEAIRAETSPDDRIWVFPHESTLYLFADRRSASRYPFLLPWTAPPRVVNELLQDLAARPPRLVVFAQHYRDASPGVPASEFAAPVIDFLASRYAVAGVTRSGLVLLRLRPEGSPPTADERRDSRAVLSGPARDVSARFPRIGPE